jgi:hypothetical protein
MNTKTRPASEGETIVLNRSARRERYFCHVPETELGAAGTNTMLDGGDSLPLITVVT